MGKKTIVVSGINLFEGGPLSVYKDFAQALIDTKMYEVYEIILLVHKKDLFKEFEGIFEIIEFPKSRKSYLFRLFYEYIWFYFYSLRREIDIWISLHDITPNVRAKKRYVYCHNPSPFLKRTSEIWKNSKTNYFMSLFYKYLYQINIKKNTAVIVQQDWIRQEFKRMFGIDKVIVARPDMSLKDMCQISDTSDAVKNVFIYSAYPRPFKNYEIIAQACKILATEGLDFETRFTIDGSENAYSKSVREEFSDVKSIKWLGLVSRDEMLRQYGESNCLIFPSLLETWGLPITEYKQFGKPMLCADLPYAHETVGSYDQVTFFDPTDAHSLAGLMKDIILKKHVFQCVEERRVAAPVYNGWEELTHSIL